MSASPTRVAASTPAAVACVPLADGNRVLESIAQQQALHSLLAFSSLHDQIHAPRSFATQPDRELVSTESFIRDEVLQLVCDRIQSVTQADGIIIALAEGDALVCRAATGSLLVERGFRLANSEFLEQCLYSGQAARCDNCGSDPRIKHDLAIELGARATVLVPLRGRRARVGALQAFSMLAAGFSDEDVRCLDLFAELILAALKPEDEDRRLNWLAMVADEILRGKPAEAETGASVESALQMTETAGETVATPVVTEPMAVARVEFEATGGEDALTASAAIEPAAVEVPSEYSAELAAVTLPPVEVALVETTLVETAPVEPQVVELVLAEQFVSETDSETSPPEELSPRTGFINPGSGTAGAVPLPKPIYETSSSPIKLSESTETAVWEEELVSAAPPPVAADAMPAPRFDLLSESVKAWPTESLSADTSAVAEEITPVFGASPIFGAKPLRRRETVDDVAREVVPTASLLHRLAMATSSSPGLSVVIVLVMVAALFSTGVWWGMHNHAVSFGVARSGAKDTPGTSPASAVLVQSGGSLHTVSAPGTTATDNLLDPIKGDSQAAPLAPASPSQLAAFPKVTAVRHWSSALVSTVAIDMEDQVPYEVHRLTSPERIFFDLHDTALPTELQGKTIDVDDLPLTRVRVAQPVAGVTRVVLDTRNGSNFSVSMESNPYRLVIQLRGSNDRTPLVARTTPPVAFEHSPAKQAALSTLPLKPDEKLENELPAAKSGRVRIVIDAGHGGWDLGTVGRQGLLEKDLVLDVSDRLGKLLKGRLGADVVFTRTSDAYLPLDQRAELANQAQADLFVSVHANYSSVASARGVETYYSNFYAPPTTGELDKGSGTAHLVKASLSPGELHEKVEESRSLAASVQHSLFGTLAATNPGIRDRGIKDAGFVVLKGTTMPSIPTEISFVSSPTDERNLRSEAYRQQIAEALYKGIARYESSTHKVKLAQVQSRSTGR